ncbi:MAG: acetolactate synthase small subunit [Candidatus Omnitrophica bacterium]|nr:acetolactate synthase small subunit [Candidatus Omnitrophota bacterium]
MKHIISVLVENHFGVLAHVSGLFSARGFNIDSLAVGETEDPTVSRMTIVAHGDDRVLEQIMKQLDKLVDVIKVQDLAEEDMIERELVLMKVNTSASKRADLMQVVNTFRGKVVDVNPKSITVEVTGNESKIDAMLELLRPFGLREVVRTGTIAIARKAELSTQANYHEVSENAKAKPQAKKKTKTKKAKTERV